VLLRYALLGVTVSLNAGELRTVNAFTGDVTLADVGLLMVTSTPTLPSEVPDPITTAMKELDNTVHDKAATPEEGIDGAIINDARVTCPPMLPEPTPELAKSADVCTITPADDPAFGAPSLQPVKVKV
jgi:hypothetical protein